MSIFIHITSIGRLLSDSSSFISHSFSLVRSQLVIPPPPIYDQKYVNMWFVIIFIIIGLFSLSLRYSFIDITQFQFLRIVKIAHCYKSLSSFIHKEKDLWSRTFSLLYISCQSASNYLSHTHIYIYMGIYKSLRVVHIHTNKLDEPSIVFYMCRRYNIH